MPQIYSKKRRTCQVSESQIITPVFPFSFLLVFFKCTLYLNSIWDKFITWRQLDGCPSLLSVHRFSWIGTACSKRHKLFTPVLDRNMMADIEDWPCSGRHSASADASEDTYATHRDATVQRAFLLPKRQWVLQSAEFVIEKLFHSFCSSVLMLSCAHSGRKV